MPTVDESLGARGQPAGLLKSATDTISENQEIEFIPYVRLVLPFDGYVFWVRQALVTPGAVMNSMVMNGFSLGEQPELVAPAPFVVKGSIHYATDLRQDETESFATNRVMFTSQDRIQQFSAVGPNLIYIGSFRGLRFAFSSKGQFYIQMKEWHYEGNAIFSYMESQIVDDPRTFNPNRVIVSNSLPAWLSLSFYNPPYPVDVKMPPIPLFPSFLSPQNEVPPYGTVHIGPEDTSSDQDIPSLDRNLNQQQLSRDRVRINLYGIDDATAQDFLMATIGYLRDAGVMGLVSLPNIRDNKRTQNELLVLAMSKTISFDVSYNQARIRDAARQLIEEAVATVTGVEFDASQQIVQL